MEWEESPSGNDGVAKVASQTVILDIVFSKEVPVKAPEYRARESEICVYQQNE